MGAGRMNILNFRIRGKMAHFRRYYSNSSALTYSVPPRTTIIGLIAGVLGYPRDSYYEEFSPSLCRIAVGIRAPQKKKVQTVNLLMIKSPNDFNGSQPFHSQTPTELIVPVEIRNGFLDYEVWFYHQDGIILDMLHKQFQIKYGYMSQGISIALGSAQHLGWIERGSFIQGEVVGEVQSYIHSIIPISLIKKLFLADHTYEIHLQKEELPIHFYKDRTIESKGDFIINAAASPVKASVSQAVRLSDGRMITWMEE